MYITSVRGPVSLVGIATELRAGRSGIELEAPANFVDPRPHAILPYSTLASSIDHRLC
jgi:hypothetical protein